MGNSSRLLCAEVSGHLSWCFIAERMQRLRTRQAAVSLQPTADLEFF